MGCSCQCQAKHMMPIGVIITWLQQQPPVLREISPLFFADNACMGATSLHKRSLFKQWKKVYLGDEALFSPITPNKLVINRHTTNSSMGVQWLRRFWIAYAKPSGRILANIFAGSQILCNLMKVGNHYFSRLVQKKCLSTSFIDRHIITMFRYWNRLSK